MQIRMAKPGDAPGILDIYMPYIELTSFTFETEVPTQEEFEERIRTNLVNWPWLVAEQDEKIIGYAYATKYRERTAYQWSVECSIYIHDDFQKQGIGHKLYGALTAILKLQGFRNVYAVINLPNEKSVAFHESCGFAHFATYENVGYKLGKWKNVGWWRLIINEFNYEPWEPIKLSLMKPEIISSSLSQL
ncbi:MAG TPA: GNAT family N-acetyltransferase [Chitinophagaceae bacterium]|nr:GNAT family N-acetyltransferase [Chitinophagaceae bacterium]